MKLNRQWVHVQLDIEDYIKGKTLDVKWSVLGRQLFKQYFSLDNEDNFNEEVIIKGELSIAVIEAEALNTKVSNLNMRMMLINENKKKELQKRLDTEMRINQGMNDSGINPLDQ